MIEVCLEGLPKQIDEAMIQSWFFEEGDPVNEGDEIVELSTGDSTIMIQAKKSGILSEVYYDEGETVAKGEILCLIDDQDEVKEKEEEDEEEDEDEDKDAQDEDDEDEDLEDDEDDFEDEDEDEEDDDDDYEEDEDDDR